MLVSLSVTIVIVTCWLAEVLPPAAVDELLEQAARAVVAAAATPSAAIDLPFFTYFSCLLRMK
jgi:hypothetical protein